MTIDEAINHAVEVMVDNLEKTRNRNSADPIAIQCFECADKYRQLSEWLIELKRKRQAIEDIKSEINELSELDHAEPTYEDCKRDVLEIIEKRIDSRDGGVINTFMKDYKGDEKSHE